MFSTSKTKDTDAPKSPAAPARRHSTFLSGFRLRKTSNNESDEVHEEPSSLPQTSDTIKGTEIPKSPVTPARRHSTFLSGFRLKKPSQETEESHEEPGTTPQKQDAAVKVKDVPKSPVPPSRRHSTFLSGFRLRKTSSNESEEGQQQKDEPRSLPPPSEVKPICPEVRIISSSPKQGSIRRSVSDGKSFFDRLRNWQMQRQTVSSGPYLPRDDNAFRESSNFSTGSGTKWDLQAMERYMRENQPETHMALGFLSRTSEEAVSSSTTMPSSSVRRNLQPKPGRLSSTSSAPVNGNDGESAGEESSPSWGSSSAAEDTPSYGTDAMAFEFERKCNAFDDMAANEGEVDPVIQVKGSQSSDELTDFERRDWRAGGRKGSTGSNSEQMAGDGTAPEPKSRKLTRLLRRTHSAGCSKEVPSYALFLKDKIPVTKTKSADCGTATREGEEKTPRRSRKTLAQDMKLRLSFLRRRNTETNLQPQQSVRPSTEDAMKWAESFEELTNSKYGLALFRAFLSREFSEENIDFWLACEDYKKSRPNKLQTKAKKIYQDYVAVQSPKEVNLDPTMRNSISSCLVNPERSSFDPAQRRIQGLLEQDAYLRFLQSELYLELARASSNNSTNNSNSTLSSSR